jgi:hypothetical protein
VLQSLDGSPVPAQPTFDVSAAASSVLGTPLTIGPALSGYPGYAAGWVDTSLNGAPPGFSEGTNLVGVMHLTLPSSANNNSAYLVHFEHFSAMGGVPFTNVALQDALITMTARTGSTYFKDGIPDIWRLRYFGSVSNILSAAGADAAGDGVPNLQKYLAGTDPLDPNATLRLNPNSSRANANHQLVLRWPTVANRKYSLQWATSLGSTNWAAVINNMVGDGNMQTFTNTTSGGQNGFYRVITSP